MKVAILTGILSNAAGGLSLSVPTMARVLRDETRVDPHVVGVMDRAQPEAWTGWGHNVHPLQGMGPRAFPFARGVRETLEEIAPDLVDVQGIWTNMSRAAVQWRRRHTGVNVVTPRGMLDPWALERSAWRKQLVRIWFEQANLSGARFIRALNRNEAVAIRAHVTHVPIAVVPNGIFLPPRPAVVDARRASTIQFIGRLDAKKGLEPLLQAWDIASRDRRAAGWRLQINGWGEEAYVARLHKRIDALEARRTVTLAGPLFGPDKEAALRDAAGFILPSFSEGLPMAVLEAWSFATPVLMTDACNIPEGFAEHAAQKVSVEPHALAQGLLSFFERTASEREAMGIAGRHLVERQFSASVMAHQLAQVYAWAIAGGAKPACCDF